MPNTGNQTLAAFVTSQNGFDTSYNGSDAGVSNTAAADFDGAFAYIASYNPSQFIQMNGATWTPDGFGGVQQIEAAILKQFQATQAVPESADLNRAERFGCSRRSPACVPHSLEHIRCCESPDAP